MEKDNNSPTKSRKQLEHMELGRFSDTIIKEAMDVLKQAEQSPVNEQALQLSSDVDDAENSNNGQKTIVHKSSLNGVITSHRNAVTTVCNSTSSLAASNSRNAVTSSPVHQH